SRSRTACTRAVQKKLDRGYEDYLETRISNAFWTRKSAEWETELATIEGELNRIGRPTTEYAVTGAKIFRTRKTGRISSTKTKIRPNSGDCSKRCYLTAHSIAEHFLLLTVSHSICSLAVTKQENGGEGGIRSRRSAPRQ